MRNLEQRINDAEDAPARIADRERRYEQKGKVGKWLSKAGSFFGVQTAFVRTEEYEFLNMLTREPWSNLKESVAKLEDMRRNTEHQWQKQSQDLGLLNEDIQGFVKHRFNNVLPERFDTNILEGGQTNTDGALRLAINWNADGYDYAFNFVINEGFFDELEDQEKALLCAIPGAINDVVTDKALVANAQANQQVPTMLL